MKIVMRNWDLAWRERLSEINRPPWGWGSSQRAPRGVLLHRAVNRPCALDLSSPSVEWEHGAS